MCERVIVIARGRIVGEGTPASWRRSAAAARRLRVGGAAARRGRARGAGPRLAEDGIVLEAAGDAGWPGAVELSKPGRSAASRPVSVLAIAGKELALYFTSLLFYVLAAVFLVLAGYLFYTNLDFFVRFGGMNLSLGLWQYQFFDMRQLLLVLVPLLTMRLFAEERRSARSSCCGRIRCATSRSSPGKFLACLVVLLALILPTLASTRSLLAALQPDRLGAAVRRAISGSSLLAAAFVACGLFLSALTDSQLVARRGDLRRAALLLDHHLERGGGERGRALAPAAVLAVRPLPGVHARRHRHARTSATSCSSRRHSSRFTLLALDSRRWRGLR